MVEDHNRLGYNFQAHVMIESSNGHAKTQGLNQVDG